MYTRLYKYPKSHSFFLIGPRGCGKSTWLKYQFPTAFYIDLLDQGLFQELLRNPEKFKQMINQVENNKMIIVDEIQRMPQLLNYVHQSIEEGRGLQFVLTGSSARKIRRNKESNLLAGRALQRTFNPLTAEELSDDFDLIKSLKFGHLPMAYLSDQPIDYLKSYVGTYLREEVQQETLTRNLTIFAKFLEIAAFSQGQPISMQSIASDIGVDRKTVDSYVQILEDMLLSYRIPVFQKRAKRKMTTKPKFYYFDVGVYRVLRQLGPLDSEDEITGVALETLVLQNLKAYIENNNLDLQIYFYRSQSKLEVDFVLYGNDGFYAIEVKKSSQVRNNDLAHIREFAKDYPEAKLFYFYGGKDLLKTDDQIHIIPVSEALKNIKLYLKK